MWSRPVRRGPGIIVGPVAIERLRDRGRTTPLPERRDLDDARGMRERDRENVTKAHHARRIAGALTVDANVPGAHELGCERPRPRHAGVPEPFVETLPLRRCPGQRAT